MNQTLTNAERYQAAMLEADMERGIRDLVKARNGRCFTVRDSRGLAVEGLPDLILVCPWINTLVFAELKSQNRELTTGQQEVIAMLEECHEVEAFVVRPIPRDGEMAYSTFVDWLAS